MIRADHVAARSVLIAAVLCGSLPVLRAQGLRFDGRLRTPGGGPLEHVLFADLDLDGRRDALMLRDDGIQGFIIGHRNAGNGAQDSLHVMQGTNYGPTAAAVGDLDGDGDSDIAFAEGNLYVLPNLGNGVYGDYLGLPASGGRAIEITDIDGDGDADLLVPTGSWLQVVQNQGAWSFVALPLVPLGVYAEDLGIGDVDADGDVDVIVSSLLDDRVSVVQNRGDGSFFPHVAYVAGLDPWEVRLADVDGDLDLDGIVANFGSASVSVLVNSGTGAFSPAVSYPTAPASAFLEVADLNGDGRVDLALNGGWTSAPASVLLNQGNGTFAPFTPFGAPGYGPMGALDADDDGDLDLARGGKVPLLNRGDGFFAEAAHDPLAPAIGYDAALRAGDLDGDGDLDVVQLDLGRLVTRLNLGAGSFAPPVSIPAALNTFVELELVDLDGDGDLDAVTGPTVDYRVRVFWNSGSGAFAGSTDIVSAGAGPTVGLAAIDVSGDALPDLLVRSAAGIRLGVNQGGGTFGAFTTAAVEPGLTGAWDIAWDAADVEGDGDVDLFSVSFSVVKLHANGGSGTFAPPLLLASIPFVSHVLAHDFDADGDADLSVTAAGGVLYLANLGASTFAAPVALGNFAGELSVADLDDDADLDLLCHSRFGPRDLTLFENLGGGNFAAAERAGTAEAWDIAALDVDDDGDDDLVAVNEDQYFALENSAASGVALCFGDGSATACPCGNASSPAARAGCENSLGRAGRLTASGSTHLLTDALQLRGRGMTDSAALYFQGTAAVNGGNGSVFGDGLRCAGGIVVRLAVVQNAQGASVVPMAGGPPLRVLGQITTPGERVYQVWYRDAASFCAPATWNLTNGVRVEWRI